MVTAQPTSRPTADAYWIRTCSKLFEWRRGRGQSVGAALRGIPRSVPVPHEEQGEAVAFSRKQDGYFTASEKARRPLYFCACGADEERRSSGAEVATGPNCSGFSRGRSRVWRAAADRLPSPGHEHRIRVFVSNGRLRLSSKRARFITRTYNHLFAVRSSPSRPSSSRSSRPDSPRSSCRP